MSKQDRQGVRTPAHLEQKYDFGNVFRKMRTATSENGSLIINVQAEFEQFVLSTIRSLESLAISMTKAEQGITALGNVTNALDKAISDLSSDSSDNAAGIRELKENLNNTNSKLASLGDQISSLDSTVSSQGTRLTAAETKVSSLEATIESLVRRVSDLESAE